MRGYQVTRKLQVTIPKRLAEKKGIRPGDSVVFEERGDELVLRRVSGATESPEEIETAVHEFARDVAKIRPYVRATERALVEGLSRYVTSKRSEARRVK